MAISRDFQFHLKNLGVQTLQLRQQLVLLFVFIGLPQKMMSQIVAVGAKGQKILPFGQLRFFALTQRV